MYFEISLTDQSAFTWKDFRMRNRLRIFPANESIQCQEPTTVTLKLGEVLEPLAEAFNSQRAFIEDFTQDEIRIPADLYEALMASISVRKLA